MPIAFLKESGVTQGPSVNPSHPLARGMVAWYLTLPHRKGPYWYDLCGNNHGTINGGVSFQGPLRPGSWGAIDLDGSADYISCANEGNFDFERTEAFSLSFWVYRDANATADDFLTKGITGASLAGYLVRGTGGASTLELWLISNFGTNNYIRVRTATGTFPKTTWKHAVITYDGSSTAAGCHIWIDRSDLSLTVDRDTLSASILNNSTFNIGATATPANYSDGKVDDVMVWRGRVLTHYDVHSLYDLSRRSYPGLLTRKKRRFYQSGGAATYTAAPTLSLETLTTAVTGTHTAPVYTAAPTLTLETFTTATSGTWTPITFTGTVTPSLETMTFAASGTFTAPVYTAAPTLTLETFTTATSGTHTAPTFTGTAALSLETMSMTNTGSHSAHGTAALSLEVFTCSVTGVFVPLGGLAQGPILHRYGGVGVQRRRPTNKPRP